MSTTDAPEHDDRPRPSRARRLVRTMVVVVLVVLLGLCWLLVLLHLPPVKTLAGASLERLLSRAAGAQVSFERLDYRLWFGVASVEGLSVRRAGLDVTGERATVRLRPSGMHVQIAGTRIIVTEDADTSQPLAPSRPWAVIGRFAGVIVERLSIELRDRDGAAWLQASDIDARFERHDDQSRGTARVARADISGPGGGPGLVGARAEAAIEIDLSSEALHLVDGRVTIGGSSLQAEGRLDQIGPVIATVKVDGRIDAPLLTTFSPAIDAEGMFDVRLSAAHDGNATNGTIEVDAPRLMVAGAGPLSGGLRGRFEGQRLLVESIDLRGSGGQASANGVVILGEGESLLTVRARGIDVANLGSAFTGTRPPLASNADLDLRLEIENWNADTLAGAGHVAFSPGPGTGLPVSGRSEITLTRSGLNFVARELRVNDARLAVDGSLSFPADLAVEYTLRLPNLAEAPALLADAGIRLPPLALEGSAEVAGSLTGQLPDWRLDARLSTQGLAVEEVGVDLDTTFLITPAGARISSLVAQGPDGHIEATGFVPLDGEREWAVDVEVAGVQLIDALSRRGIPMQATIDGRVQVDGPASQPRARFTVEALAAPDDDARGSDGAMDAPARLHAAGSVSHRNLILEQVTAEVAGGRVSASGSWTWSDSSLDGRLTADGIAIERLPWLSAAAYEVTSTLSADLSVSGTARAPVGHASVTLSGNRHRERVLSDVTLEATADGGPASLNGRIGARSFLTGTLAFHDEWPLRLDLDLAELPITELLPALPALSETDATVALSGRLSMDLPALSPRDVRFQANVTHLDARLRRTWQADAFTVTGDLQAFEVRGLTLETGTLRLYVEGRAALDESVTDAVLTIRGEVPLSDLAAVIPDAELDGKADLDVRVTGSVLDPALDGTLQLLAGPGRLQRLAWKDAQLRGRLADETFTVEEGRATLMGGEVSMTGSLQLGLGTTARGFDLRVTATGVDLAPFFATADGRSVEATSTVRVDFTAQLAAPELTLAALDGQGQLTRLELAAGEQALQLDAPVTWSVRDGTLDHSPLRLRGPSGAALDITTQLQAGQFAVRVKGQADLAVAQPFLADTARVSGPVVLDLALATGPDGVTLTGDAKVDNARILLREPRLAIDGLTGTLRATGARVELVDVSARVGDGQLTAAGYVTLPATATSTVAASTADRGFDLRVTATGVDLAPFVALGGGRSVEATSTVRVDFTAQLAAPELTLAALDGQGQLTRLELAAGEQALQLDAPVTWSVRDGTLDHSPLRLRGPSGAALDITTQLQAGQFAVRVKGQADLAVAQPFLADTARVSGPVVLDLAFGTGPDGVTLTGDAKVDNARILLREPRLAIDGLTGTLRATGARVELVDVSARVGDGQLTAAGYVTLPATATSTVAASTADRGFDLRVTATGVDLAPFVALGGGRSVEATSTVRVDFTAQLAAPELTLAALDGQGQLTRLELAAGEQALQLDAPVTWSVRDGTLDHSPLRLRGPSGAALDITTQLQAGQFAVRVNGQADLAVAQPFLADTARVSGPVVLDLAFGTGPDGVTLTGDAKVDNARILLREPRLAIDGLTGTLRATGARVELVDVSARVGDGQLTAAGYVTLPTTDSLGVDVNLKFDRVPLSFPEGLRSRASGTIRMVGGAGRYRLEGDVALHRAVYDRKLDRTTQSLDRVGLALAALDASASPLQRAELDIRMRLEDGLRIENEEARLVVDGAVRIGGDLLTPDVRGTLALREGGTVQISQATLRISQGRIELDGFPAQAAELNIQGSTQVTGVLIDATISGPVDNFNLSLSSRNRSDLTQGDLASLILTGRTASDAMSDSGAIVAERLAASLGRALDTRTGSAVFIDVSRDEDLIVQDTNPSQRLNIGVPVGRNLFVIYSNALDRNAPRWTVELRPTGELRVRAISDSEDGNAIQVAHRFSFNVWSRRSMERPATTRGLRIARILFEGLSPEEEASLRRSLSLEPGGVFDYFRADESARDLSAELQRQGYSAATVEFADRDVGSGRVDVIFDVQRGPRFDIEWRGDDPGGRERRRVEEGWDSFFPVEDTAARLAHELRWTLRADRYFNASVSASATVAGEAAHVTFDVRRGARGRRVDLVFEGNDAITAQALRAALPPTDDAAFFRMLDTEGRTQLTSALRLAYAREGFLEAVASAPLETFDAASGVLSVTVPIDEGPPARVAELDLPEDVRSSEAPPPDLQLAVGQPFRIDAYIEDRGRLVSWYREQGFTTARVTSVLAPVDDGLAVRFGVDPGPRARVGDIRIARAGHTRRSVVNNALTLAPGDLITPSELQRSRRYLADTGVFRSVEIRPESTVPGKQDLVIDLLPRDDLTVEYNVRYTTDGNGGVGDAPATEPSDPIQFGAAIEASNPFGFAHRYRLYGLVGGERALLGASFDAATFFGRRWRTQVFLFDDEDRVADIPRLLGHIRGTTFQQTKRWQDGGAESQWRDSLRMIWGYTYKRVHYLDSTTGRELSGDRAGLIHSLIGDTRDDLTDPHRGVFWSVGTELALQTLGSDVDYAKLYGQLYYYLPLGAHVVWAQGYRVGVTPGDDPLLLLEGRFHAGGASSVRGFEENTLGPQTGDGESLGGQAVAIFNQELRFPIVKRLWGGIFYDAGNAFALTSDLALGSLRHSAGGGLRLMMPFGPVRLEYAWVLDPKGGENRSRWVFSLGHAF